MTGLDPWNDQFICHQSPSNSRGEASRGCSPRLKRSSSVRDCSYSSADCAKELARLGFSKRRRRINYQQVAKYDFDLELRTFPLMNDRYLMRFVSLATMYGLQIAIHIFSYLVSFTVGCLIR